jgi:hypothetical protein
VVTRRCSSSRIASSLASSVWSRSKHRGNSIHAGCDRTRGDDSLDNDSLGRLPIVETVLPGPNKPSQARPGCWI